MAQLYVFTGENAWQLREEKLRWLGEFTRKYGPENLTRLSSAGLKLRDLLDEVSTAPFIAARRLVAIDGIPRFSKEEIDILAAQVHPQTLVLFVDPKPDKRLGGVKHLLTIADVKSFAPLAGKALTDWMVQVAAAHGAALESTAAQLLLEHIGEDQDLLSGELAKLSVAGGRITRQHVERLAVPTFEGVVWKLTDLLSAGRRTDAMSFAHRYLDRGGDAYGLWAILLNMLRNVTGIAALAHSGRTDSRDLSAELGIHFFAVKSLLPYARRVQLKDLRAFLDETVEADIALKTGGFRATDDAPEELLALIDRFLLHAPV